MTITPALFGRFYPCRAVFDVLDPLLCETKEDNIASHSHTSFDIFPDFLLFEKVECSE